MLKYLFEEYGNEIGLGPLFWASNRSVLRLTILAFDDRRKESIIEYLKDFEMILGFVRALNGRWQEKRNLK